MPFLFSSIHIFCIKNNFWLTLFVISMDVIIQRFLGWHLLPTHVTRVVEGSREMDVLHMTQHVCFPGSDLAAYVALELILADVIDNFGNVFEENVPVIACKIYYLFYQSGHYN